MINEHVPVRRPISGQSDTTDPISDPISDPIIVLGDRCLLGRDTEIVALTG